MKLMEDEGSPTSQGAYWRIRSIACSAELVIPAQSRDDAVGEAELRLRLESGLVLGDLEKGFGPWKLIFESKTSAVSFKVAGDIPAAVFARLFTRKALPESPVLSLQLRRDEKPR